MFPYFFLLIVFSGWLLGIFKQSFYAVVVYVIIYFNMPQSQWWGYLVPDLRYSLLASGVLFFCYCLHKNRIRDIYAFSDRSFAMLVALFLLMVLITPFAFNPSASWARAIQFGKYLISYYLIVKTVEDIHQYKVVLYTFVLNFFYLGYLGRYYFTGQRLDGIGVSDASDANLLAAFIVLIIPFLVINFFFGKKWEKIVILLSSPFILNLFLMTRSRGGFVGLFFSFIAMVLLYKNVKNKAKIFIPVIIVSVAMFYLSDQRFINRVTGLFENSDVAAESSGRYEIWGYGLQMLLDYPFGAGGDGFALLSPKYLPKRLLEQTLGIRVAHNTYIQVLVEQGYIGLFLFLLFIFFLLRKLHAMRSLLELQTDWEDKKYLLNQSYALESGLIGFFFTAFFIDRIYFEGLYLFSALASIIYNISIDRIMNNPEKEV